MKNTLKISILFTVLSISAYADCIRDNSNETVTCSESKLVWQDNTEAKTVEEIEKTWNDAINYCENLDFAGKSDWRLPNVNELLSIVDYSGEHQPAINPAFNNRNSDNYYHSSTSNAETTDNAWYVNFQEGFTGHDDKQFSAKVRCVRAGQ